MSYPTINNASECLEWCTYQVQNPTCAYSNYPTNYTACELDFNGHKYDCGVYADAPVTGGHHDDGYNEDICWAFAMSKFIKLNISCR